MNISDYLHQNKISTAKLAKRLGVSQGLVSHWITGRTRITAEKAILIEEKTGGTINRHDLRPDLWPKRPEN